MSAIVKIKLGNLFDGPSDMIVIPCSTAGTITRFVANSLASYSIPRPRANMNLGDVEILPFDGADNIAQYVAFAASVLGYSSTTEAIESIGYKIGKFTQENPSVKHVSAPLLGAGAGGLRSEDVAAALKRGFQSSADPSAVLIVFVLHENVYDRLRIDDRISNNSVRQSIRVFISHTSATEDEKEWVKSLALFLLEQGFQARIDILHLRHGMDLSQWMCNELFLANKVIIICDEKYKNKADGRLGGVGWETMIIQGDMANLPPDSTKYQVVVRENVLRDGMPLYLRTRYAFHAPKSDKEQTFRFELAKELLDLPPDSHTNG